MVLLLETLTEKFSLESSTKKAVDECHCTAHVQTASQWACAKDESLPLPLETAAAQKSTAIVPRTINCSKLCLGIIALQ